MILSILYVPGFARVTYAGVLSVRAQDYVEAVRVLGAGPDHAAERHGSVLVQVSLTAAAIVLDRGCPSSGWASCRPRHPGD